MLNQKKPEREQACHEGKINMSNEVQRITPARDVER